MKLDRHARFSPRDCCSDQFVPKRLDGRRHHAALLEGDAQRVQGKHKHSSAAKLVDEVIKWSAANFPSAAGAKPDQVS